jgi:hypothetical protein
MRRIRELARIAAGILKELSDQSPYQRHLAFHGRAHSGAEWRRFSEERLAAKYTRPKCC